MENKETDATSANISSCFSMAAITFAEVCFKYLMCLWKYKKKTIIKMEDGASTQVQLQTHLHGTEKSSLRIHAQDFALSCFFKDVSYYSTNKLY